MENKKVKVAYDCSIINERTMIDLTYNRLLDEGIDISYEEVEYAIQSYNEIVIGQIESCNFNEIRYGKLLKFCVSDAKLKDEIKCIGRFNYTTDSAKERSKRYLRKIVEYAKRTNKLGKYKELSNREL